MTSAAPLPGRRRTGARRGLATVAAALTAVAAPLAAPASAAPGAFTVVGDAQARVATPQLAGYSVVVPVGVAQAELDGTGARASSAFVDWTVPSTLARAVSFPTLAKVGVPTQVPPFPGPLRADSNGRRDLERPASFPFFGPTGAGNPSQGAALGFEQAHAGDGPSAWSRTDVGALAFDQLAVAAGSSRATASGAAMSAGSSLGELRLGPPGHETVVLRGIEWRASQARGAPGQASFTVGSAFVDGAPHPVGGPDQLAAAVAEANRALEPTGLRLELPTVDASAAGAAVGPLVIRYTKSQLAGATVDPAYGALAPVLFPLVDALQQQVPEVGTTFYVLTVLVAALSGHADLRIELGGASAHLGVRALPAVQPSPPPPPALAAPITPAAALPASLGAAPVTAAPAPATAAAPTPPPARSGVPALLATPVVSTAERVPGWLVVTTLLGGLAGAALVAAAERSRRQRRLA